MLNINTSTVRSFKKMPNSKSLSLSTIALVAGVLNGCSSVRPPQVDTAWNIVPHFMESDEDYLVRQNNISGSPAVLEARAANAEVQEEKSACLDLEYIRNLEIEQKQYNDCIAWENKKNPERCEKDANAWLQYYDHYSNSFCARYACAVVAAKDGYSAVIWVQDCH